MCRQKGKGERERLILICHDKAWERDPRLGEATCAGRGSSKPTRVGCAILSAVAGVAGSLHTRSILQSPLGTTRIRLVSVVADAATTFATQTVFCCWLGKWGH